MFHSKLAIALLGVASLTFGPASVSLGDLGASAAYAKGGNGGGGGGGNGGGNGGDKGASSSKSDKASERGKSSGGKSTAGSKAKSEKKKKQAGAAASKSKSASKAASKTSKAKQADVVEASTRPKARDMGKMNGALNANINAVLAHIRNGNLNGPVGLLAGLAIADANAASAEAKATEMQALADAHDALTEELKSLDITLDEYLAGEDENGPLALTQEEIDRMEGLIADAGGLNAAGDGLATTRPEDAEIEAAKTEATESGQAVADAESAIIDAWNKEGDEEALLTALRDRLEGHEDEIADAIASTSEEETAEAPSTTETEEPVAAN